MSKHKDPFLINHEEICEVRYNNINEKLDIIIDIQKDIQELKQTIAMGSGALKAIFVIGSFLSVCWGIGFSIIRFVKG